jgi:hypothetical protein
MSIRIIMTTDRRGMHWQRMSKEEATWYGNTAKTWKEIETEI